MDLEIRRSLLALSDVKDLRGSALKCRAAVTLLGSFICPQGYG